MHIKVVNSFRPSPLQGTYRASQLKSYAKNESISGILDFVLSSLLDAQVPSVKSDLLCLVNAYNLDADQSIGYAKRPPQDVIVSDSGLVLTFAMTPRTLKNLPVAAVMQQRGRYSTLWGFNSNRDYITICVPRSIYQSKTASTDWLNVVYNAVGVMAPNFCRLVKTTLSKQSIQPEDIRQTADTCEGIAARAMVSNLPMTEWVYCPIFWKEYSHCLIPSCVDKDFPVYYSIFLDGWVYEGNVEPSALDWIKAQQMRMIQNGLAKLSVGLVTGYIDDTNSDVQGTLAMILKSSDKAGDLRLSAPNRSSFVSNLNIQVQAAFRLVPKLQSNLITLISQNQTNLASGIMGTSLTYRKQAQDLADYLEMVLEV